MTENRIDLTIMKNVMLLAQSNKKSLLSQRNLLNKWFQDSVKNYIFDQIASPLIQEELQCSNSAEVKAFIHKGIDKNKPKYMGIIEQYFYYIKKFDLGNPFIQNLNKVIQNPIDLTKQAHQQSFSIQRMIRKQFVCYLILRFFEQYGQQQIPSFYELWNYCYPQQMQKKRKLSKYDIQAEKQNQNSNIHQTQSGVSQQIKQNYECFSSHNNQIQLNINQHQLKQEIDHLICTGPSDQFLFNNKSNDQCQDPSYFQILKEASEFKQSHIVKFEEDQVKNSISVNYNSVCEQDIENQEYSLKKKAQTEWPFLQSQVKCEDINQSASQIDLSFPSLEQNQYDFKLHHAQIQLQSTQQINSCLGATLNGKQDISNLQWPSFQYSQTTFYQFKVKEEEIQQPCTNTNQFHIYQQLPNCQNQEFSTTQSVESPHNCDKYQSKLYEIDQTEQVENINSYNKKINNFIFEEEENEEIEYVYAYQVYNQQDK
ncbi:hypothetical protein ABPG74_019152 [Tetrahymena malaccensis]